MSLTKNSKSATKNTSHVPKRIQITDQKKTLPKQYKSSTKKCMTLTIWPDLYRANLKKKLAVILFELQIS